MKPLLETPITRERREIGDYIPAKDQDTLQGCADFLQRQRERIARAQHRTEAKVTELKRKQ